MIGVTYWRPNKLKPRNRHPRGNIQHAGGVAQWTGYGALLAGEAKLTGQAFAESRGSGGGDRRLGRQRARALRLRACEALQPRPTHGGGAEPLRTRGAEAKAHQVSGDQRAGRARSTSRKGGLIT